MTATIISDSEHIELKRLHVIVESLVIKEQLRQQTQVLTVDLGPIAIHFKHRYVITTIDFIAGRTTHVTLVLTTTTPITEIITNRNFQTLLIQIFKNNYYLNT